MFHYLKKCRSEFFIYSLVSVVYALILAATGFVYARVSESALSGNQQVFLISSLIAVGFFICDIYFDYLPRYLKFKLVNRIMELTRNELVATYAVEDIAQFEEKASSDRVSVLVNHLDVLENGFLIPGLSMVTSVLVFTFSLIGALYLQGTMTIIMLVLCFIPFLAPLINNKILAHTTKESQEEKNVYLKRFSEFVQAFSFIRISNITPVFEKNLETSSQEYAKRAILFSKKQSQTYAVSYGLSSIVYSGSWIIGGIFVFQGMLKISDLIAMTTLMGTVAGPIQTMSGLITEYLASRTVVEELTNILKGQPHEDKVQQELTEPIRTLTLDRVSSHNQQHPIFDNFSYQFLADKKYAIVGKSGSGKTTLLRLLLGVQSPDEGAIFINQINLLEVAQASYFDKMYYLPQKTAIFATTIGDNLTLFETLDEAKALKCLEQVGLLDWFERQEAGFDTPLSSSKQLSGGEERRFDLARALYRDAEVLLFDEPTTGLDSENETFIAETLSNIKEKLLIVVTHSQSESFLSVFDEKVEL